jgi:outer membrane lipoprotein LolB
LQQNESGLIAQLQQGGWSITYNNYKNYNHRDQAFSLPGKITAEHDDVRLILVIRDWQLGN